PAVPKGWGVREDGEQLLISPTGELDMAVAPALRDAVQTARELGMNTVVVDLTEVSFLDSMALSVLISGQQRLLEDGGHLDVVIPPTLRLVFETSGVADLFGPQPG